MSTLYKTKYVYVLAAVLAFAVGCAKQVPKKYQSTASSQWVEIHRDSVASLAARADVGAPVINESEFTMDSEQYEDNSFSGTIAIRIADSYSVAGRSSAVEFHGTAAGYQGDFIGDSQFQVTFESTTDTNQVIVVRGTRGKDSWSASVSFAKFNEQDQLLSEEILGRVEI